MKIMYAAVSFILSELVAAGIFYIIRQEYNKKQSSYSRETPHRFLGIAPPAFKGILERLVIFIGLIGSVPQILIVFGTLKIATRIKPEDGISNDYFLIGNLASLGIVITAYLVYLQLQ